MCETQGHKRENDGRRDPRAPEGEPRSRAQRKVHDDEALDGEKNESEGGELLGFHVESIQKLTGPVHFDGPTQIQCSSRHVPDAVRDKAASAFNQKINFPLVGTATKI